MKVLLVLIEDLDIIGHVFPDHPNIVHYVKDGVRHESSIKPSKYMIIEELEIQQEDI